MSTRRTIRASRNSHSGHESIAAARRPSCTRAIQSRSRSCAFSVPSPLRRAEAEREWAAKARTEDLQGFTLRLRSELAALLKQAKTEGDVRAAIMAVKELGRLVEVQAKLRFMELQAGMSGTIEADPEQFTDAQLAAMAKPLLIDARPEE
jgi:hypothetical protein